MKIDGLHGVHRRVIEAAQVIAQHGTTPLHRAFAEHLRAVGAALLSMQWIFEGGMDPGEETEAIRAVVTKNPELEAARLHAEETLQMLARLLGRTIQEAR